MSATNVGVLELTIESNAGNAATSLAGLADALGRVRDAVGTDSFGLGEVGKQLNAFAKQVAQAKSTVSVLKTISEFGNAMSKLSKIGQFSVDTESFEKLKTAVSGFSIGNIGSQMNQLRLAMSGTWGDGKTAQSMSDLHDRLQAFANDTPVLLDFARAMKDASSSLTEMNQAVSASGDWRMSMMGASSSESVSTGANVAAGLETGMESCRESLVAVATELAEAVVEAIRSRLEINSPSRVTTRFGEYTGEGLAVGLQNSMPEVVRAAGDITDSVIEKMEEITEREKYIGLDMNKFMPDTVSSLPGIFRNMSDTVTQLSNSVGVSLPKMQQMSSEEMIIAGNARAASEAIKQLMSRLNEVTNPNGKGFSSIVNVLTGVEKQNSGGTLINASTTMFKPVTKLEESFERQSEMTAGVVRMFDEVSGSYKETYIDGTKVAESNEKIAESMEKVQTVVAEGIQLQNIPASGKNGVFANANEEMQYLIEKIEQAKLSQQQFNDIAEKSATQLKYGGPMSKDELSFNLKHATEGFYEAAQAEEVYQGALRNLMIYAADASERIRQTSASTQELPITDAVTGLETVANNAAVGGMESFKREIEEITNAATPAVSKIELLRNKIAGLEKKIELRRLDLSMKGMDPNNDKDSFINGYKLQIAQVNEQIGRLINKAHQAQDAMRMDSLKQNADNLQRDYGTEMVQNLVNNYSQIDLLEVKLNGLQQALADDINQNKVDTQQIAERTMAIQNLKEKIQQLKDKQDEANESAKESTSAWKTFKSGVQAMFPTLTGLLKRFKSISTMRGLRYVIRQISAGFSEGVQNVYQYSKVVGTNLAPAMDNAKSSLNQFKNSIGAAVSPLITALVPALQTVVNWLITGINYINQFFALLNGQATWTKALYNQSEAYDDTAKKAKNAGSAVKDLLADWDELNIIQSNSGSGTGSDTTTGETDYTKMFEEVGKYEELIKTLVDGIKEQFGDIWTLVKKVGVALLGWKLSSAFSGLLGILGALVGTAATIDLVFNITEMFDKNFIKTGDEGWLILSVLTPLIGGAFAEKMLKKVLGGEVAQLAIPLMMTVSAFADIKTLFEATDKSAISKEALELAVVGALKTGTAAAYLAHIAGSSLGASFVTGGGLALLTFGAAVGIKAVARAEHGLVTEETVKAAALSSLSIGVGAGIMGKLLGATVLGSVATGMMASGLTLITLAAAIGIKAYLTSKKEDIEWGSLVLTEAQIRSFVWSEMFEANFKAKLELTKATVEASQDAKDDVQAQVEAIEIPVSKLKWKLDEETTVEDLKKLVFGDSESGTSGLIGKFKELAKQQETLVETSLTLVPIKDETGADQSGDFANKSIEGWDILTDAMDQLGVELNTHLVNSMNKNLTDKLREYEKNAAVEIVETMARVSRAAASGLTSGQAEVEFEINLQNMSRENVSSAVDVYREYIDEIKKEYVSITTETAASFRSQSAAFAELAVNTKDPKLKKYYMDKASEYEALFQEYKNKALHGVEDATKADQQKGRDLFVNWIKDTLQLSGDDFSKSIDLANSGAAQMVKGMLGSLGVVIRENDGEYTEQVSTEFNRVMDSMLKSLLKEEDYNAIKNAIDAGLLSYTDIFDESIVQKIIDYVGDDSYYGKAIRQAWENLIQETVGQGSKQMEIDNEVVVNTAVKGAVDKINQLPAVQDLNVEVEPEITNLDDITKEIEQALSDGIIDASESFVLMNKYGANEYYEAMKKIQEDMDEEGRNIGRSTPWRTTGAAGMSDSWNKGGMNYINRQNATGEQEATTIDYDQMAGSVRSGATSANAGVIDELQTIIQRLNSLLAKEWKVNINPTSTMGAMNSAAAAAWGKVNG